MKTTFILFLMFFVSPPAKPGKQVWSLNSTTHFEFATMEACKAFGIHLQSNFANTTTTTVRGWCVNQETGGSTKDLAPGQPNPDYYEIPPVPPRH
jgi:hypothetical protein